ncbi:hypothetical protein [Vibrio sp. MA40-2]|uniref:hypothetical protein n=1 Tax=Vibrio sp. MA40-2 TaxID=3391828 RepID=UPI0039A58B71
MKKYIWLFLVMSHLVAAAPVELFNQEEKSKVEQINQKYQLRERYNLINARLSLHSANVYQYNNLINRSDLLAENLYELVINTNSDQTDQSYKELADVVLNLMKERAAIDKVIKDDYSDLNRRYDAILQEFAKLKKQEVQKNADILLVYGENITRLENELSDNYLSITVEGSLECSITQTLNGCIEANKKQITNRVINESIYLSKDSYIDAMKVNNATIDMSGLLNYQVTVKANALFNDKVVRALNKAYGLESADIILVSNKDAEWFVDGKKIGEGKRLSVKLPMGIHAILAIHRDSRQSSVENIIPGKEYRYNLVESAQPNATTKDTGSAESEEIESKRKSAIEIDEPEVDSLKSIPKVTDTISIPSQPSLTLDNKKHTMRMVHTDELKSYYLISNEDGSPLLLSDDDPSLCEPEWGKLATLKEYLSLLSNVTDKSKYLRFNFSTLNNGIIRVMEHGKNLHVKGSKGIGVCVQDN